MARYLLSLGVFPETRLIVRCTAAEEENNIITGMECLAPAGASRLVHLTAALVYSYC